MSEKVTKKLKITGIALMITLLIGFVGCATMQDVVVPCNIDPSVGEYTGQSLKSFNPLYTTLYDAKRLQRYLNFQHMSNQEQLLRDRKDDRMKYGFINDTVALGMAESNQLKEMVFSPSSPIGALIPTLLAGTLGATLISKPSDKKKIVELEKTNGV